MDNNLEITKKPGNKKVTIINIILIIAIFHFYWAYNIYDKCRWYRKYT